MSHQYTCQVCFGPSDSILPLLDTTCSACKRNQQLLQGQERIARDAERYSSLSSSDRDDLKGLKAVVKQLIKDMAAMEERFDAKLVALSEYLGK
jgi:hypothetical protein